MHIPLWAVSVISGFLAVLIAAMAVYFWQHGKVVVAERNVRATQNEIKDLQGKIDKIKSQNPESQEEKPADLPAGEVGLVFNRITFVLPAGWVKATAANFNMLCSTSSTSATPCVDVITVVPAGSNNTSTVYKGVSVKSFQNNGQTAKDWFLNDYKGPKPSGADESSSAPINGHDSYYYLQRASNYTDLHYVIVTGSNVTHVYSRLTGPKYSEKSKTEDFSKYMGDIKAFASSIGGGQ